MEIAPSTDTPISPTSNASISAALASNAPISSSATSVPSAFSVLTNNARGGQESLWNRIQALLQPTSASSEIEDLPRLRWDRAEFILESSLAQSSRRSRVSWIRDHGIYLFEVKGHQLKGKAFWLCKRCAIANSWYPVSCIATTTAHEHLKK
jgi:hypothetical protein